MYQCNQLINCKVTQKTGSLVAELKKEILSEIKLKLSYDFSFYQGMDRKKNK